MLGPTIAQRSKFAEAEVGITIDFMSRLEAAGADPLMILAQEFPSISGAEDHIFLGDVPGFQLWDGDRVMGSLMAHKFRVENLDWASGIVIHKNEILDDRLGFIAPRIADLAAKAARHKGDHMVKRLIQGFSGTAFDTKEYGDGTAFDGSLFFATNHSLEGGPSQSNKLTVALSAANLESAEILLAGFTTWDGKDPLDMRGTHLIVGPKLEKTARELVGSAQVANAGGTATISNPYFQGRYQVVVSPRLTGTYDDYWFLADLSKATKPLIFQNREPITTAAQTDWASPQVFSKGILQYGAQARYGFGLWDWRTVVGSIL